MSYFVNVDDFKKLSVYNQETVKDMLQQAVEHGLLVSVRAEDFLSATSVDPRLTGVHTMTEAQAENYAASGGSWSYVNPTEVAREYGLDL